MKKLNYSSTLVMENTEMEKISQNIGKIRTGHRAKGSGRWGQSDRSLNMDTPGLAGFSCANCTASWLTGSPGR